MKLFELTERVNHIHQLIEAEATGDPESFAEKLGIRKRQLFNILDELKLMGAPICYDIVHQTYYYSKPYRMYVNVELKDLNAEYLNNVNGGDFLTECNFIALVPRNFVNEGLGAHWLTKTN